MVGAWSPWTYHDDTDTLVGYDVEVSRAIAEYMAWSPSMWKASGTACLQAWMPAATTSLQRRGGDRGAPEEL